MPLSFREFPLETVRKVGVWQRLFGTLPCMRKTYHTDLSDAEWTRIESHLPVPKAAGRPRTHPPREILNAIFYVLRSGCAWRLLPHDFPPWKTVHHYFRVWRLDGVWERLEHCAARALTGAVGKELAAQRRNGRLTVGQNDRGGRRGAGIRWREEGTRQKAASVSGHGGTRPQGQGPQ